ncbi:hypothetical protein TWF694_000402 [Orbilia ellipsospora]|uniref:Peptidase A1 domain-containing protein n=1 Tax=Orbilia ellipsospora TaxID=2528407 RepID=A0AAV9XNH5_9PEZI
MFNSQKSYPNQSITCLIALLVIIKLTSALPAPRPFAFPQISTNSGGSSNPILGSLGFSANSWCQANSDQAILASISSASEYSRTALHTVYPQTAPPTAIILDDGVSATPVPITVATPVTKQATVSPVAKQAVGSDEAGYLGSKDQNRTYIPTEIGNKVKGAMEGSLFASGNNSHGLIPTLKRLFKRQTAIQPSDPCRHPNPVFPDEGGPSVVTGCNTNPLAPDGTCPHKDFNTDCAFYCETRREYFYGKEQRWSPSQEIFPYPDAPLISVSKGESITIGISFDFGFGLDLSALTKMGLSIGLGFSRSWTWTSVRTFSSPAWNVMHPYCGFFTFLPKMVRTCGILTQWELQSIVQPMGATIQNCNYDQAPKYSQETCVETPWRNANGDTEGVLIIAKVVCGNEQVLAPPCQQDKLYLLPGVIDTSLVGWNMTDGEAQRWVQYSS